MANPRKLLEYKDGDLIGFSGEGLVSDGINVGTFGIPRWHICHIGIVSSYRGRAYIFESTTTNGTKKCAILGKEVNGVQAHPIEDILSRPGKVWKYPLQAPLYRAEKTRLTLYLLSMLGEPYDYLGAGRTAGFFLRTVESVLRTEDLSKVFCSELCSEALTQLGRTRIVNSSGQNPNSLVRYCYREGITTKRVRQK